MLMGRVIGWSVAIMGPVAAWLFAQDIASRHKLLSAAIIGIYCLFLLGVGFVSSVLKDLRERWEKRATEGLDNWARRTFSGFTRYRAVPFCPPSQLGSQD
jgi:hypothetical protein